MKAKKTKLFSPNGRGLLSTHYSPPLARALGIVDYCASSGVRTKMGMILVVFFWYSA